MKTGQEIQDKLREKTKEVLTFWPDALLEVMTFEEAKPFLKPEATPSDWPNPAERTEDSVVKRMREYMSFAWSKAEDHRGISASRSVDRYHAWLWVLDREHEVDWDRYENYGAPILKRICELFGFEDAARHSPALARMAQGFQCDESGCDSGCG